MRVSVLFKRLFPCLLVLGLTACSGGGAPSSDDGTTATPDKAQEYNLDIPMVTYKWDQQAGDPNVPADMGGPGFSGEGWTTNMTFPAFGSAKAVKGGEIVLPLNDWPSTLRLAGKESNNIFSGVARSLITEALISLHPLTNEFIPKLASHWQISEDKMTYRFRINPAAKFSDGSPVTAEDVVASWSLQMNPDIMDPSGIMVYGKLNKPVAVSKYIVEVTVKQENWRNPLESWSYWLKTFLVNAHYP